MTNDIELLPLWLGMLSSNLGPSARRTAIQDYARANVLHHTTAKDAELVELRSTIEALRADYIRNLAAANSEASRAERLEKALRLYIAAGFGNSTDFYKQAEAKRAAQAALHPTAAQEGER